MHLCLLHSNTFSHNNKSIDLKVLQYILTRITPQKWITSTFGHKNSLISNAAFTGHFISESRKKRDENKKSEMFKKSNPRVA